MLVESAVGAEVVERGELSLFANGIRFEREDQPVGDQGAALEVLLVPFSFVRPVAMQSTALQDALSPVPFSKILSVTLYLEGRTHFFCFGAWEEQQAQDLCTGWVRDVARSIRWVTESLFTRGSCFQTASPNADEESNQLMAGYLLHSDPGEIVRMMYVELQPPRQGKSRVVLYEDLAGGREVDKEVLLDARTPSYEKVGVDCSCFCVGSLQLSARTVFERQVWLRAVQNLKVKLQARGPDPRPHELDTWREAINDHIIENAGKLRNKLHMNDHRGTCAATPRGEATDIAGTAESAALARTAEELRGMPLLRRCVLTRPEGDNESPAHPEVSRSAVSRGADGHNGIQEFHKLPRASNSLSL
jgi:hypothetical protein